MLIITRRPNESVLIGDDIQVVLLEANGRQARIGVQAPREIPVHRQEVYLRAQAEAEKTESLRMQHNE